MQQQSSYQIINRELVDQNFKLKFDLRLQREENTKLSHELLTLRHEYNSIRQLIIEVFQANSNGYNKILNSIGLNRQIPLNDDNSSSSEAITPLQPLFNVNPQKNVENSEIKQHNLDDEPPTTISTTSKEQKTLSSPFQSASKLRSSISPPNPNRTNNSLILKPHRTYSLSPLKRNSSPRFDNENDDNFHSENSDSESEYSSPHKEESQRKSILKTIMEESAELFTSPKVIQRKSIRLNIKTPLQSITNNIFDKSDMTPLFIDNTPSIRGSFNWNDENSITRLNFDSKLMINSIEAITSKRSTRIHGLGHPNIASTPKTSRTSYQNASCTLSQIRATNNDKTTLNSPETEITRIKHKLKLSSSPKSSKSSSVLSSTAATTTTTNGTADQDSLTLNSLVKRPRRKAAPTTFGESNLREKLRRPEKEVTKKKSRKK